MVHDIAFMFRHGVPCMSIIPTEAAVERLRRKGYTVYVLQDGAPLDRLPTNARILPDSTFQFPRIARL
ncbi:MAG: hypothetical protein JST66_07135 [Bacteroidetes bacterium]|nr:hypothetical protein [Bacteroidota bacterium]